MGVINIENQFNKALRLLDFGKIEKASEILNEIIIEARKEQNSLFFIRASCVLGELLFSNGKTEEAKQHLVDVVNTPYENDVVDYEKSVASNILDQIQ
jgi:hypothetical protein